MQKRKENLLNHSSMSDEALIPIPKRKNTSKSALDDTSNTNTSALSNDMMESSGSGTPKKNERRYMVCHEILDTEENYLRVLNLLNDVFREPLEMRIKNGEEKELVSRKELNTLFKKIIPIIHVHSYIHQNLRKQITDWKNGNLIGKIWADSVPDLEKVYPPYINSYDDILMTLDSCDATKLKFHEFIKQAEARPECQKNSVRDLFIRPVQRIPSVLLLLQELLKRTDKSNPDFPWIKAAIEQLKGMLEKSNESRRKTENFKMFMEVCQDIEDLPDDLIASHRQFIQQIDMVVINAGGILHKYRIAKSRFCTSELNSTVGNSLNSSFSSSHSGTLSRQTSMVLRRGASWKKERRRYKHIELYRFTNFRSVEVERENEVFVVKIRDQKADELCFFQPTNGYDMEMGIEFFENLIQRIVSSSSRDIALENITLQLIRSQAESRPEEAQAIFKAARIASELSRTGTISRRNSLRKSISNINISLGGPWHTLSRIGSMKRSSRLDDISES